MFYQTRYKLEIPLLFNRAVTTTNILFKEEDEKKGEEKGKEASDQRTSRMCRMMASIQTSIGQVSSGASACIKEQ